MGVDWTADQRARVEAVLDRYPPASGACADAAAEILPIAKERDASARRWRLLPPKSPRCRYVVPNADLPVFWDYHVTTEVEAHCVDALTGADGTLRRSYLDEHWQYGDAMRWTEESP